MLPVEFARKSSNGRITLVLLGEGFSVPSLWSELVSDTLEEAQRNLADREGCSIDMIGSWPGEINRFQHVAAIGEWASAKGIGGVVWTALPPRFEKSGSIASAQGILTYLRNLREPTRRLAMEYVRRTPRQITTPYRAVIEKELGWTCESAV